MIVYRIASVTGKGPYQSAHLPLYVRESLEGMYNAHWGPEHPIPSADSPGFYMEDHHICAFSSQDQLLKWFDGFEELLDELGFLVWEIEIPDSFCWELTRQTVIDRYRMTVRDTYTLV